MINYTQAHVNRHYKFVNLCQIRVRLCVFVSLCWFSHDRANHTVTANYGEDLNRLEQLVSIPFVKVSTVKYVKLKCSRSGYGLHMLVEYVCMLEAIFVMFLFWWDSTFSHICYSAAPPYSSKLMLSMSS